MAAAKVIADAVTKFLARVREFAAKAQREPPQSTYPMADEHIEAVDHGLAALCDLWGLDLKDALS